MLNNMLCKENSIYNRLRLEIIWRHTWRNSWHTSTMVENHWSNLLMQMHSTPACERERDRERKRGVTSGECHLHLEQKYSVCKFAWSRLFVSFSCQFVMTVSVQVFFIELILWQFVQNDESFRATSIYAGSCWWVWFLKWIKWNYCNR